MTLNQMIEEFNVVKQKLGTGDIEVPVVRVGCGENEYVIPDKILIGDFIDQDGDEFKCALIGIFGGEEFTEKGIYHWKWNPLKNNK